MATKYLNHLEEDFVLLIRLNLVISFIEALERKKNFYLKWIYLYLKKKKKKKKFFLI
jgi:hypothetical protein